MKALFIICDLVLLTGATRADSFDKIKARLAAAQCVHFEFVSVLDSRIFKESDTSAGSAYISRDGRYVVTVGSDEYLCDGKELYSYSPENNQVTVQLVDSTTAFSKEVSYITRLDEFFKTRTITSDRAYRLVKISTQMHSLPDSMTVRIDRNSLKILQIEYLDINNESVSIIFKNQTAVSSCDERRFTPSFPDSVQQIRM
jgi:outer membrane lipoprotein-sorting protein